MSSQENQPDLRWAVYLLECSDRSLYCGITTDLDRRMEQHNAGKASKYTRSRLPVQAIAVQNNLTRSDALKLELRIKKLPAELKVRALSSMPSRPDNSRK